MPRNPEVQSTRIFNNLNRETLVQVVSPLSLFIRCESPAFVRRALDHARNKDLHSVDPTVDLLPPPNQVALGGSLRRSDEKIESIMTVEHSAQNALNAATHISNARVLFDEGRSATEGVRPILYYYGALSFIDFVTYCLVRRGSSRGAHGLSVTCASDGWNFHKDWPRKECFVRMASSGDFPFYVDALTVSGFPSLFSGFRLHQSTKVDPLQVVKNPLPLLSEKMSLDLLCNFDFERHVADHPRVDEWLGSYRQHIMAMTARLLDFLLVFAASCLARYYVPAWHSIVSASETAIYNDIRRAYQAVAEELPFFFAGEHPFQYSFGSRI